MKLLTLFAAVLLLGTSSISCNNNQDKKQETIRELSSSDVNIYYFHFTRRCPTCMAVEENARLAVESLYYDKVKTGEYSFITYNLDEDSSKLIADKYGVGGQTLLVVKGDKKIDITSSGFLNAHDPEKIKQEIKSAVDKVIF